MRLAVVLTHWGDAIPQERLAQHWLWNDAAYRKHWATVYVVAEGRRDLPDYARLVPCYEDLRPFNLARTSNLGIRRAVEDGAEIVIKTDPDVFWPWQTIALCASLGHGRGVCPTYMMAPSRAAAELGPSACTPWKATCGTLALHADTWRAICGYDERMKGYGVEDGDACARARKLVTIDRAPFVYHIAHVEGSGHGKQRADHWGRADGSNPLNHKENMRIFNSSRVGRDPWTCEDWGTLQSPYTRPFSPRLDPSILFSPEGRANPQSGGTSNV